jgi:hypothetical protein
MKKSTCAFLAFLAVTVLWASPAFAACTGSAQPKPNPSSPGKCESSSVQKANADLQACMGEGQGAESRAQSMNSTGTQQESSAVANAGQAGQKVAKQQTSSKGASGAYQTQGSNAAAAGESLAACASEASSAAQAYQKAATIEQAFKSSCPSDCSSCSGTAASKAAEMQQLAQNCGSRSSDMGTAAGDAGQNASSADEAAGMPPASPPPSSGGGKEAAKKDKKEEEKAKEEAKKEETGGVTEPNLEKEETAIDSDGKEKTEAQIALEKKWKDVADGGSFTKKQQDFIKAMGPEAELIADTLGIPVDGVLAQMALEQNWSTPSDPSEYASDRQKLLADAKYRDIDGSAEGWAKGLAEAGYKGMTAAEAADYAASIEAIALRFR